MTGHPLRESIPLHCRPYTTQGHIVLKGRKGLPPASFPLCAVLSATEVRCFSTDVSLFVGRQPKTKTVQESTAAGVEELSGGNSKLRARDISTQGKALRMHQRKVATAPLRCLRARARRGATWQQTDGTTGPMPRGQDTGSAGRHVIFLSAPAEYVGMTPL